MFQRTVVEISAVQFHEQTVAVMDLRPKVERLRVRAFAEPVHGGKRREPQLLHRTAQRDFSVHIDDRLRTGRYRELIGSLDALAVQKRPCRERGCLLVWT